MTNDDLMDQYFDLLAENDNWESMARALRGGLRMIRADMDLTLDHGSDSWEQDFIEIRDSINDLLKGVVGEK